MKDCLEELVKKLDLDPSNEEAMGDLIQACRIVARKMKELSRKSQPLYSCDVPYSDEILSRVCHISLSLGRSLGQSWLLETGRKLFVDVLDSYLLKKYATQSSAPIFETLASGIAILGVDSLEPA
jgi:hypothetical protein